MAFAKSTIPAVTPGEPLFSAVLRPHRSLSRRGFRIFLTVLAALSLAVGVVFFVLGAWLVTGFLGLDVLAVYLAFRLSYRGAAAAEEISVSPDRLTIRRVAANGRTSVADLNPYWARLEVERWPSFGIVRMAIVSRGQSLPIGDFLGPGERETLAEALTAALAQSRSPGA